MKRLLLVALLAVPWGCKKAPPVRCVSQADCPVKQICLERQCVDPASVGIHAVKPGTEAPADEPSAPAPPRATGTTRVVDDGPAISRGARLPQKLKQQVEDTDRRYDSRVERLGGMH